MRVLYLIYFLWYGYVKLSAVLQNTKSREVCILSKLTLLINYTFSFLLQRSSSLWSRRMILKCSYSRFWKGWGFSNDTIKEEYDILVVIINSMIHWPFFLPGLLTLSRKEGSSHTMYRDTGGDRDETGHGEGHPGMIFLCT